MSLYCKRPGCGHVDGNHPEQLDPKRPCLEHGCACKGLQLEEDPATAKTDPPPRKGLLATDDETHRYALALVQQLQIRFEVQGDEIEEIWVMLTAAAAIAERGILQVCRETQTLQSYADAQAKLKRVLALIAADADHVEGAGEAVPHA